ncbi:MAG: cation-transporting ATPase [Reichenbachiella sp.]
MKSLKYIIITGIVMIFSLSVQAQESKSKTCEFEVLGVCGMCKERIENAAYIKGVKFVEWDNPTGKMTVIYKPGKITELEIHQSIAAIGHDTDQVKADSASYATLPDCCAYRNGVHKH